MRIDKVGGGFVIDVKRFYLPFVITSKCPKCDTERTKDMRDEYLSYPETDQKFSLCFYCRECSEEWYVGLVLGVELKPAGSGECDR